MIVTLAGHVDHGKTSLVEALTGTNTDTLAEEKRRGLTIDLGFAYVDFDGHRVGFVDVPGHHRFIHNMVAGVASHQQALLVVAADDGPMPQTREHLDILSLLGVRRGIAAVTKIDRVTPARYAEVVGATEDLARRSGLHLSAIVGTSAVTKVGLDELRGQLAAAARVESAADDDRAFRLSIDRAFVIKGTGLVVTGTVHSGEIAVGGDLTVAPSGKSFRVRSLRVSNETADRARAGDRCAVNLAGAAVGDAARGDWLVAPDTFAPSKNIVLDLTVLGDFPRPVKHWLPVHAYHAASHAQGHIALLDSPRIEPGRTALVELVLEAPLHTKHGDRIVLRDHARERTIGGGSVVAITRAKRARRAPERIAALLLQRDDDHARAFAALLAREDVDIDAFRRARALSEPAFARIIEAIDLVRLERDDRIVAVDATRWRAVLAALDAQIAAYHQTAPHSQGLKTQQIRSTGVAPAQWLEPALGALLADGRVRETGGHFHKVGHRAALPPDDATLLRRVDALIDRNQPPSVGDIAKSLGIALRTIDAFLTKLANLDYVVRVGANHVLKPARVEALAETARRVAENSPAGFDARSFRDAAGIGRNLAIDVLEYFDRRGFTRRFGDVRRIVGSASNLTRR